MFVIVQHEITDANTFFGVAKELTEGKNLPAGLKLHFGLPNTESTRAVCMWEAPTVDAVRTMLETKLAKASRNTYYQVNPEKAAGLPAEAVKR